MDKNDKTGLDGAALERVMERLKIQLEELELNSWNQLQAMIKEAVELELAAEEMTREELDLLTAYVRRDLEAMGSHLHLAGEGIASWLNFDLNVLEQRSMELLMSLADSTRLEQAQLREQLTSVENRYLAGEVVMPGTLVCVECGVESRYLRPDLVRPCDQCGGDLFERVSGGVAL